MDRLSLVIVAAAAALGACEDRGDKGGPPPSRVDSVKADPKARASLEGFCDVQFPAERAPAFALPTLAGSAAPASPSGWRWVNVWATWCKPCLEELPRLQRWRTKLGERVAMVFVSADESDDVVTQFRASHPDTPEGPRLADPDALPTWLATLGLDAAAPIPIHVFVDPEGRTRCVRAGGVGDEDYAAIAQLFGGS